MEYSVLDVLYESVQVWDSQGIKLYCNQKTFEIFEADCSRVKKLDQLMSGWSFYDSDNHRVPLDGLPHFLALSKRKPYADVMLKMISDDAVKWILCSAVPQFDGAGVMETLVTTAADITNLKADEQKYKSIANYDPLTKLPNRTLLSDRIERAISHTDRNKKGFAVCLIDLDGFKEVNDKFGHDVGDTVLVEASKRMKRIIREGDTVARLGGDEFVILITGLSKSEDCAVMLYRLLNVLSASYTVKQHEITSVSASIGVSMYPDDRVEADTLLRHADIAMYKSKNSGKNRFSFFDIASDNKIKANFRTINKIKQALQTGEFRLYYQPKVNARTGEILEVEALARWMHPLLGIVSPAEFLPLVENDEELCKQFDQWVITEAIRQLQEWQSDGLYLKVCVNISPRQFKSRQFVGWLKGVLDTTGVPLEILSYLEFEILETAAVESLSRSNEIVQECKALGLSFALDDFGTGYSSLMHLKELTVDTIKIDKVFVSGMLDNSANMVIVQAIVALANAFDITVTAEGVETIEHVMSLLEMGCDAIQGYVISKPLPAEQLEAFIMTYTPDPRWKMVSHIHPSKADFELLLAASNHKYWLESFFDAVSAEHIDTLDAEALSLDYHACRLGKWFETAQHQKYRETSGFETLSTLHRKIHDKVKAVLEVLQREKRSIRQDEIDVIQELSGDITEMMENVRQEMEQKRRKSNLVYKILEKRSHYGSQ